MTDNKNNMRLWNAVSETNPKDTKKVTLGRSFTAIDPYAQIRNATEQFGPAGNGWGWDVTQVQHLPTNQVAVCVRVWTGGDITRGVEQWGQAGLFIDNAEKKKDHDCMKKATTDAITKCLSYMGFNADVFLGKFDDNKYVSEMNAKFEGEAKSERQGKVIKSVEHWRKIIGNLTDERSSWNGYGDSFKSFLRDLNRDDRNEAAFYDELFNAMTTQSTLWAEKEEEANGSE